MCLRRSPLARGFFAPLSATPGTNPTYAFKSASKQRPKHKSVLGSPDNVGPGSYETHKFQTLAQDTAHAVSMGSRQNPGFGIGSPQHHLPHETALNEDEEVPGPGKYSLPDPSLYLKARTSPNKGPTAAFRMPMARKKQTQMHFDFSSAHTTSQKAPRDVPSRKSKKKQESGRDMVHV